VTHFAILAPPLRGHYRPLSNLAAELIARGHRATFVHHRDARALVEADGAGFEAIGADLPPVASWTHPMARIHGLFGLGRTLQGMAAYTDAFCREGPALLDRIGAEAIVADQLEPAGGLLAEALGLPFASVATTLPIDRDESIPPPYVPWDYRPGESGRRRNRGGWAVADLLLAPLGRRIARNCRRLSIPVRTRMEDCLSDRLQVAQIVRSFDFPRESLPEAFHYTGPFRRRAPPPFALPDPDGRPLVYCTLGTLQGSRIGLFRKVALACRDLGLRLLITRGGPAAPRRAWRLPGDPSIYDWVPQEAVVAAADLTVSHAGMNAVLDPLAAGIPSVVMPLAFEQPAIAARLARTGAGLVARPGGSVRTLRAKIALAREDGSYRARARALAAEIAAAGGVARAADLIEAAIP